MKRILSSLATINLAVSTTVPIVACGANNFNQKTERIFEYISNGFRKTIKTYYSDQEVYLQFKEIVDSFNDENISITYNKNTRPNENLFLVDLEPKEVIDRYTKIFLIKIYQSNEGIWSNTSTIGSDAIVEVKFGTTEDGIKLEKYNFVTNSGNFYATTILNYDNLKSIKFSLDPFENFTDNLSTQEIDIKIEENKILLKPKYDSFSSKIYVQAVELKNNQILGTEINVENNANEDKRIKLNDQSYIDLVYPANREITWIVNNNDQVNGIQEVYSIDPKLEIISNQNGVIKAKYNSTEDNLIKREVPVNLVPINPAYQILKISFAIYPDNVYFEDEWGNPVENNVEFKVPAGNQILKFKLKNYDPSFVKYLNTNYSPPDSLIIDYDLKSGELILIDKDGWVSSYVYEITFGQENHQEKERYYKLLTIYFVIA